MHGGPVLHVARDVRGQVVQQHVGKHHGLDTLASPQRQAGVEVGVVAVERALDAVDAQEDEEQEAENRDRERLGMSAGEGETVGAAAPGRRFFEKVKVSKYES